MVFIDGPMVFPRFIGGPMVWWAHGFLEPKFTLVDSFSLDLQGHEFWDADTGSTLSVHWLGRKLIPRAAG